MCSRNTNSEGKLTSCETIVELYTKIPDYAEVQHLGNSEFIKRLEELKEEFRQCRARVLDDNSDLDYLTERTSKVLNLNVHEDGIGNVDNGDHEKCNFKINNRNLFQRSSARSESDYLSVKGCEIHRGHASVSKTPKRSLTFQVGKNSNRYRSNNDIDDDDSDNVSTPDSVLSKWSSNPEICSKQKTEFNPSHNTETRLLLRKPQNNSAPLIAIKDEGPKHFKANPVPNHVHEPLFDYIMLKNKIRSQKVRELSKQKLLSQLKPFSFAESSKGGSSRRGHLGSTENLNNAFANKPRRASHLCIKTNNRLSSSHGHMFRAKPAPPRSRALMAAIRLKEQQEYRELKKRLRSEALMRSASLPPSMAARDKKNRSTSAKIDAIIKDYCNSKLRDKVRERNLRESSSDTAFTDEDRMTEESYLNSSGSKLLGTPNKSARSRHDSGRKSSTPAFSRTFKPYGVCGYKSAGGVFESTANDNNASRLRVQATKRKEEARIRREEEDLLKMMRGERRRHKLRESHLHAWRRACSYSTEQDISMRRQLRMAAAILETDSFRRDMTSMLTRVRSAPLLLEGPSEKNSLESCKKHRCSALLRMRDRSHSSVPKARLMLQNYSRSARQLPSDRFLFANTAENTEKSETAAVADGSLTDSDNESVNNIAFDDSQDEEEGQQGDVKCHRSRVDINRPHTSRTTRNDVLEDCETTSSCKNNERGDDIPLDEVVDEADDDDNPLL